MNNTLPKAKLEATAVEPGNTEAWKQEYSAKQPLCHVPRWPGQAA